MKTSFFSVVVISSTLVLSLVVSLKCYADSRFFIIYDPFNTYTNDYMNQDNQLIVNGGNQQPFFGVNTFHEDSKENKRCLSRSIDEHETCLNRVADHAFIRELAAGAGALLGGVSAGPAGAAILGGVMTAKNASDSMEEVNKCNSAKGKRDLEC